jgi:hypothetical protein
VPEPDDPEPDELDDPEVLFDEPLSAGAAPESLELLLDDEPLALPSPEDFFA